MGIFYKPRLPRKFNYHPLSYDPRKEALARRTEKIRQELIEKGELTEENLELKELEKKTQNTPDRQEFFEEMLHEKLRSTMSHLPRQEQSGKSGNARAGEIMKFILILFLVGLFAYWLFSYQTYF